MDTSIKERDRTAFINFVREQQGPMEIEEREPMEIGTREYAPIMGESDSGVRPMSLGTVQIGGGEEEQPFSCLYIDGRMLGRDEMLSILASVSAAPVNPEGVTNQQLCNMINDIIGV